MAIAIDSEWEIQTGGSATNGGGFKDLNPGTSVDYSQQAAAQLALTDIASNGAGTGISSTTGGFTAAMVGNCMYISGTGFTTGWYQITAHTDTNNITIDRSCGASASGGTGNVGGAWLFNSTNFTTFFNSTNKGQYNIVHVKAGTYTGFGTAVLTIAAAYMTMRGYNTTRGDSPEGTNRPFFNFGNNACYFSWSGGYGRIENIRIDHTYSTSSTTCFYTSSSHFIMRNCKVTRSGYTNAYAVRLNSVGSKLIQCEVVCTNGRAVRLEDAGCGVYLSYIHDSSYGVTSSGSGTIYTQIQSCIIDTITNQGISQYYGCCVRDVTIYNCGTALIFTSLYSTVFNSIFKSNTTALNSTQHNYSDNNIFHGNTTDRTGGILAGPEDISSDPLLADPANQDFTLDATSPAFNSTCKLGSSVGLP